MIKNFKDTVVLLITAGILILLAVIIVGDYLKKSHSKKIVQSMNL
jgi:hypothetical protein